MPVNDEELKRLAALFSDRIEEELKKHRTALGFSENETVILRRIIEDYTARKQRLSRILDGIMGALGLSFVLAVLTGLGYWLRNILRNGL